MDRTTYYVNPVPYNCLISSPIANLRLPSRYCIASEYVVGTTVRPIGSWSSRAIVKKKVFVSRLTCDVNYAKHILSATHARFDLFHFCFDCDVHLGLAVRAVAWLSRMDNLAGEM